LVTELTQGTEASAVDSKNIRRRVYDALNVLMAMDIIEKDKKDIQWKGLPQVVQQERNTLQSDFKEIEERLEKKKEQLAELESQRELYKKLILKNQARENFAAENSVPEMTEKLFLPFIIVQTKKETIINCEMSPDRDEYFFDFSLPFSIFDDNEILNHLEMNNQIEKVEIKSEFPQAQVFPDHFSQQLQPQFQDQVSENPTPFLNI